MNDTKYRTDVDNYKQFSEHASALYKFMVGFLDKYGVLTVDWVGYTLGLNKEGRPISKQTPEELSESIRSLGEKLKQPEIREAFIESIKEMEPVLKEAVFSLLNVALGAGEFIMKDIITFVCSDTPAAPVCGLFKFANNAVEFGEDILDTSRSSLNSVKGLNESTSKLFNKLQDAKQKIEQRVNNATQEMQLPVVPQIKVPTMQSQLQQNIPSVQPIMTSTNQTNVQSGGAKAFKKYAKERKTLETRLNKSLRKFLNLKKSNKTRRKRRK